MTENVFKKDLESIKDKFFQNQDILKLIEKYTMNKIVKEYLDYENINEFSIIQQLMEKISTNSQLYQFLLFKTDFELIKQIISNSEVIIRQQVGNAIHNNVEELYQILKEIFVKDNESYKIYIDVIIYQLVDPEIRVAQYIIKAIKKMAELEKQQKEYVIFQDKYLLEKLNNILKDESLENSEQLLRVIDLVVDISNLEQELQQIMEHNQLLIQAVMFIKTKDILLKLGVVEIISKLGNTQYNQQFILKQDLLSLIKQQAFDQYSDFYVQKYMIILLCKMLNTNIVKLDDEIKQNLIIFIKNLLQDQNVEQKQGIFSILQILFQSQKMLDFIAKQPILIQLFMKESFNTQSIIKKQFLNTFCQIFYQQEQSEKKDPKILQNIFYCLGNIDNINSYSPINEIKDNTNISISYLFKLLSLPFEDYEYEALKILQNLLNYEFGIKEIIKQKTSIQYLLKSYCKNKEIFDLKRDINDHLSFVLIDLGKKDQLIYQFNEQYQKEKANKTAQQQFNVQTEAQ